MNGFTESPCPEELTMVELEGGGGGLPGSASCPAVLPGRVSSETSRQMLLQPAGEDGGETPASPELCAGKHRQSSPDVNMANGELDRPVCKHPARLSSALDGEEVRIANGGLHIVTTGHRVPCDRSQDCSPEHCTGSGPGCVSSEAAPPETQLPIPPRDPPTLGQSAKPASSPCPSSPSHVDSPLSEPNVREEEDGEEEEDDFSDLSLPVRPQSLRTNPTLTVSLSCDATPLSPDEPGGFYFGDEGYKEDLRMVLEAGRRQSAPDKLPDLAEHADNSDPKQMPKRFGIADFFTR